MDSASLARELRHITGLGRTGMKFDLDRFRRFLAAAGSPQDAFPSVHVAGTNGKGSVCAMLAAGLRAAGLKVGLTTSPHLEHPRERFLLNGIPMSDGDFVRTAAQVRAFARQSGISLTQFEFFTAMAFLWFREKKVDVAVVETGLGGRLDATNAMERKALTVITSIGLDHTAWLGDTEAAIAREKAGILRPGVPLVTSARRAALAALKAVAHERFVPVVVTPLSGPQPRHLIGRHQRENAAVALAALCELRVLWPRAGSLVARRAALAARWPGRMERFVVKANKRTIPVILDGAHNPPAARALARALRDEGLAGGPMIFGLLRDKDAAGVMAPLSAVAGEVHVVTVRSDRATRAAVLARRSEWRGRARAASSFAEAWGRALRSVRRSPVVVAGSLYLVGEARTFFSR